MRQGLQLTIKLTVRHWDRGTSAGEHNPFKIKMHTHTRRHFLRVGTRPPPTRKSATDPPALRVPRVGARVGTAETLARCQRGRAWKRRGWGGGRCVGTATANRCPRVCKLMSRVCIQPMSRVCIHSRRLPKECVTATPRPHPGSCCCRPAPHHTHQHTRKQWHADSTPLSPRTLRLNIAAEGLEVVAGMLQLSGLIAQLLLHRLQLLCARRRVPQHVRPKAGPVPLWLLRHKRRNQRPDGPQCTRADRTVVSPLV